MVNVLMGVQIVLGFMLITAVIPQESKRAKTTSPGEEDGQEYYKPKGKEAFLANVTKITAVLFFINALALVIVNS